MKSVNCVKGFICIQLIVNVKTCVKYTHLSLLTRGNETFAGLAGRGNQAFIWHEITSGRKDEDIASSHFAFLISNRDAEFLQSGRITALHRTKIGPFIQCLFI